MLVADERIALVDLDGTVADYDAEMARQLDLLRSPEESPTIGWRDVRPHIEARRHLIKNQPGFWRNLPRLHRGFEVVDQLRSIGFELHVLTKGPVRTTSAWTEKVEWSREHLPDALVTITQEKSLVYGRVLVDDWPNYFTKWLRVRPRGQVICVAQPWNAEYAVGGRDHHPNVYRYDRTNPTDLIHVLQRAYDRVGGEGGR